MGTIKTKGIVISESNMGDFDKMLTILTPNGKIGCIAKGARRTKNSLMAATQFLCFGDYMMFKSNEIHKINSAEIIEVFYNLRIDLDKLNAAVEITKLINQVTDENQNTYKILQLFLNTLYVLSEMDKNVDLVISTFKIKLMCYLGFAPNVNKCSNCGLKEDILGFSMNNNGVVCSTCKKVDKSCITLSNSVFVALTYIVKAPPKKLYSFDISDESIKELELLAKLYIKTNLYN